MEQQEFLNTVLPSKGKGYYCITAIKDGKTLSKFSEDYENLLADINELNSKGYNSYFSQGVFKEKFRRKNVCAYLRSLYLDIDCDGRDYATEEQAFEDLDKFIKAIGLPKPTVVHSGGGFHCYWHTGEDIPSDEWLITARKLKSLCNYFELKADPSVTTDESRLLRLPNTQNHKRNKEAKVLLNKKPTAWAELRKIIEDSFSEHIGFDIHSAKKEQLDDATKAMMKTENFDSSFKKIVKKTLSGQGCNQLKWIMENQETCNEPKWFAGLSIAAHSVESEQAIHLISNKHPEYSKERTIEKAERIKGPFTCSSFEQLDSSLCEQCVHRGKITSPIQLGKILKEAKEANPGTTNVTPKKLNGFHIPNSMRPYVAGENGGIYLKPEPKYDKATKQWVEQEPITVYENDLYVVKRVFDSVEGESFLIRLQLPQDGTRDFLMPNYAVNTQKFGEIMRSNGVMSTRKQQEPIMNYVTKWIKYLQTQKAAEKTYQQQGWTKDNTFVLGDKEYRKNGVFDSTPTNATREIARAIRADGDFETWKKTYDTFNEEGLEVHAFFAFGGFATPLIKFTEIKGGIINLYSRKPGTAKTTAGYCALSIWGNPTELMIGQNTYNARYQRLGAGQNLPLYVDEISNMESDDLSKWAYAMPQGKGKIRQQAGVNAERENRTTWESIAYTTSNTSIYEILARAKSSAEGEMARCLQLNIEAPDWLTLDWCKPRSSPVHENYGHAGVIYAQWLAEQKPEDIKERLNKWVDRIIKDVDNVDRHWVAMLASHFAGAEIAYELDLTEIDYERVYSCITNKVKEVSVEAENKALTSEEVLSNFINKNIGNLLILNKKSDGTGLGGNIPKKEPRGSGALVMRYEPDTSTLYILKSEMKYYCDKIKYNFKELESDLEKSGTLIDKRKKVTMHKGWNGGVGNQRSWAMVLKYEEEAFETDSE